jgi:hypothetical protein
MFYMLCKSLYNRFWGLIQATIIVNALCAYALANPADLEIDGTYEAALDLPRIYFLLQHDANGPPIYVDGSFELNYAFLDTGASGLLLSRETADIMGIATDPNALFVDTGVAGNEYFDVSEPLYIGVADFAADNPDDTSIYKLSGPWRFQVKQAYDELGDPIDVLGIPLMAGKTVVLNAGATNDLSYFTADIKEASDYNVPAADFVVPLRFEKYLYPDNPENIPPLPAMAYNPVIDNITVSVNGSDSTGTWLFDTGATISLISVEQGMKLGLVDANGEPLITPDFEVPIGGIGGEVDVPGFTIDSITVPTLSGFNLVYKNARVAVHDIVIYDEALNDFVVLDGVLGSNFLCATMNLDTWDISGTIFDRIIIDTRNALLGFDVNEIYAVPHCGDANHPIPAGDINGDCKVNMLDMQALALSWLDTVCASANNFCGGSDIGRDGKVNLVDYSSLAAAWGKSAFISHCGDAENPWRTNDFNRDCSVDWNDIRILADEWLNSCDWLNWNCRGADINKDGLTNLVDVSKAAANWDK